MKRKPLNVFSVSFLDCITCALGAIILLFVIINARSAARQDALAADLRRAALQRRQAVEDQRRHRAELRAELSAARGRLDAERRLAERTGELLRAQKSDAAAVDQDALAAKAAVNALKSDVKILDAEVRRLKAAVQAAPERGSQLRAFPGQGDRQYLTDLKMGGERILILVDASASMLDETILGAIRRRYQSEVQKRRAPKWRRAVETVAWLTAHLPANSRFQVAAFNETAHLLAGEGWLSTTDPSHLDRTAAAMRALTPEKGTCLIKAFEFIENLAPPPDNIFLLIDSLPTLGTGKPWGKRVSGAKRLSLFQEARKVLPEGVPVNVILYPMEGDPMAADAYWRLSKRTQGAFLCPSPDWP